jgi:gamma-glutamylcysteine synthetase
MSTRQVSDRNDPVIESRDQLIAEPMAKGEKPRERLADRHRARETGLLHHRSPRPFSYDEKGGIRDLLMALTDYGWEPVIEGGKVSSRCRAATAPSAWNLPASSNCRARRSKTCTRPAPKPGGT